MGNQQAVFNDEQIDEYQDCTFFTRKEILRVFKRYRELKPSVVPKDYTNGESDAFTIPPGYIEAMPEFRENPFKRRICEVFSEDQSGHLTFGDFLEMFSVFSEAAPKTMKASYAFKIYDFDGDDYLSKEDLARTVNCLTRNECDKEEIEFICAKVIEEADLDNDGKLTFSEFEHVISRSPEFLRDKSDNGKQLAIIRRILM